MTAGRRWLLGLGAGAASVLTLAACTGSGSGGPSTSRGPSASVGTPGTSVAARSTPPASVSSARSSGTPLPTSDPAPLSTVPTRPVRTLAPVPLRSPAEFGTGVTARVTSVTHGVDRDRGPGAATGRPTVEFHLRLTNTSERAIALRSVQVNAAYGSSSASSATPAITATSGTRPFRGSLGSGGGTASAVYAFAVPSAKQGRVLLTVSYVAGSPTVLLTGSAR